MCHLTKVLVWVDGGCERNGMPDAHAYASVRIKGHHDKTYREDLPSMRTCNEAEYGAVLMALDLLTPAIDYPGLDIEIYSDSALVVSQVMGNWKMRDARMAELAARVRDGICEFSKCGVNVALRQSNHEASVAKLGH